MDLEEIQVCNEVNRISVLFARHERELDLELKQRPFATSARYLEDDATGQSSGSRTWALDDAA